MAREIAIPFRVDESGAIATVTDPVQIVRQHLVTFIATSPQERVMRADYGTPVQEYVFESMNSPALAMLETRITDSVTAEVPDVVLEGFQVSPSTVTGVPTGTLELLLEFSPTDTAALTGSSETTVVIGSAS